MVQINFAQKQINAKIVYYGPGMSGKTTNLEVVHQRAPEHNRGDLTSISTDGDRTLFFDYMPLDLGSIAGMRTCFQMYTVPGQVYYNSTRKLVLQGVDGVIFVADSGAGALEANIESLRNLEENLNEYGKSLATLPHVIQFNKRDLDDAMSLERLAEALNLHGAPMFEAVASTGQGVFPTLKGVAQAVLKNIQAECSGGGSAPSLARTGYHARPALPKASAASVAEEVPVAQAPLDTAPPDSAPLDTAPIHTAPTQAAPLDTVPLDTVPTQAVPTQAAPASEGLELAPRAESSPVAAPVQRVEPSSAGGLMQPTAEVPAPVAPPSAMSPAPAPAPAASAPTSVPSPAPLVAPPAPVRRRPTRRASSPSPVQAPTPSVEPPSSSRGDRSTLWAVAGAMLGAAVATLVLQLL